MSKLNAMHNNRYPQICYKALIQLAVAASTAKNNWIKQIKKLFNLLDINLSETFLFSINLNSFPALIKQFHTQLSNFDHERVVDSNSLSIYPSFLSKLGIINAPYLIAKLMLDQKNLLCQLRLITSHSNYLTFYNTQKKYIFIIFVWCNFVFGCTIYHIHIISK